MKIGLLKRVCFSLKLVMIQSVIVCSVYVKMLNYFFSEILHKDAKSFTS